MENRGEQERKELNRRLLRRTVVSELKDSKKGAGSDLILDFVVLFVVLLLAEVITALCAIEFWLAEVGIAVLVGIPLFYVKSLLRRNR